MNFSRHESDVLHRLKASPGNFYKPQFGVKGRLILLVNAVFMATKFAGDVYDYRVREFEKI